MRQHDDIGQPRLLQHLDGDGGARHLHQRQDPLLHPRAAGGGEQDQRPAQRHRPFARGDDGVADIHPHRARHEREVLACGDDRRAPDLALGHQHRLALAGRALGGAEPLRIGPLVAEVQRVRDRCRHRDFDVGARVEQRREPCPRRDRHVMVAARADVEVRRELPVKQHRAAGVALGPQVLRHLAPREQRVDLRPDVVRDPVHGAPWNLGGDLSGAPAECNSRHRPGRARGRFTRARG